MSAVARSMVARDAVTERAAQVHELRPETAREKQNFKRGMANAELRQQASMFALDDVPPRGNEIALIHDLHKMRRNRSLSGATFVPLASTQFSSTRIMHLETKNIHSRVFGGLLMHEAHDLAYAAVAVASIALQWSRTVQSSNARKTFPS